MSDDDALPASFWVPEGDAFRATVATRGPWSNEHQHGGPPSALLARQLELDAAKAAVPLRAARITIAFHRPIGIDLFRVSVEPVREGKKVRIARAHLTDASGRAVATAEALFLRRADVGVAATADAPPRAPDESAPYEFPFFSSMVGYHKAMEGASSPARSASARWRCGFGCACPSFPASRRAHSSASSPSRTRATA